MPCVVVTAQDLTTDGFPGLAGQFPHIFRFTNFVANHLINPGPFVSLGSLMVNAQSLVDDRKQRCSIKCIYRMKVKICPSLPFRSTDILCNADSVFNAGRGILERLPNSFASLFNQRTLKVNANGYPSPLCQSLRRQSFGATNLQDNVSVNDVRGDGASIFVDLGCNEEAARRLGAVKVAAM